LVAVFLLTIRDGGFAGLALYWGHMKISGNRPGSVSGASGVSAYTSVQKATATTDAAAGRAPSEVASVLGIPESEFTPRVRDAIVTLMGEVDRLRSELEQMRSQIEAVQALADQDGLVPLLNRRAFVREMSRILDFGERYDLTASLVYFDLDGFKTVNDTFGHAAGDAVLRHVARILTDNVRESDVIGRLGGDEFGLIMAKADRDAAERKATFLAAQLSGRPFEWNGYSIKLSMAHGVHVFQKGENVDGAMENADRAMYSAKRPKT
jgi:diguanylate cyclase (GGDEF)-like protein